MPMTESKRRHGKKDIAIYQAGMAKEGGRLDRLGKSLNVPKNVSSPKTTPVGPSKPTKEVAPLGEQGRGIIYSLKAKTAIEENKMERKEKKK